MEKSSIFNVEVPSGKDAAYENFPVGSWLLHTNLRPHIATFYRFARTIDDIADNSELAAGEKIKRLEGFGGVLSGNVDPLNVYGTALLMRESLEKTNISTKHCLDLIDAFKQDAVKNRYDNWDQLMEYCVRSAAPVGRYLLDLHGASSEDYGPSDALCSALQVINHLQDCKDDYLTLDRVYLPRDWMEAEGMDVDDLCSENAAPPVRRVINRTIAATENLMCEAWKLPDCLNSRRLTMESVAVLRIAERLIMRLRKEDPLCARIQLTKIGYLWQFIRGAIPAAFGAIPSRRPV